MKAYIGTKVILAEPCTKEEFTHQQENSFDGSPMPELADPSCDQEGYMVGYSSPNNQAMHLSWSPKDVFERSYREVSVDEADLIHGCDDSDN